MRAEIAKLGYGLVIVAPNLAYTASAFDLPCRDEPRDVHILEGTIREVRKQFVRKRGREPLQPARDLRLRERANEGRFGRRQFAAAGRFDAHRHGRESACGFG